MSWMSVRWRTKVAAYGCGLPARKRGVLPGYVTQRTELHGHGVSGQLMVTHPTNTGTVTAIRGSVVDIRFDRPVLIRALLEVLQADRAVQDSGSAGQGLAFRHGAPGERLASPPCGGVSGQIFWTVRRRTDLISIAAYL